MAAPRRPLVQARGLVHVYETGELQATALRGVDLDMTDGERLAVMGRSGSGKTTLLNILAGLEIPTGGHAVVAGHDLTRLTRRERQAYRRTVVGYVWQQPEAGLLPGLSALQNVLVPMLGGAPARSEEADLAVQLLEAFRLGPRAEQPPSALAPGEQQRLALAVALANRPRLLLADELTAAMGWGAAQELLGDLRSTLDQLGTAAVIVTHDERVQRYVDRVLVLRDGVMQVPPPAARARSAVR
jgi:putative ABC transport system ATP-binding protein